MRLQDVMLAEFLTDCSSKDIKPNPVNGFIFWNVTQARLSNLPEDEITTEKINICQAFLVETILILKEKGYSDDDLVNLRTECEELVKTD